MSMDVDFDYPSQIKDVKQVKEASELFMHNLNKMMVLMKELGMALQSVSQSYVALTSLSMNTDGGTVKDYVHRFSSEIVRMKEGGPFQNYNRLVHQDVLTPVLDLKTSIKEAEKAGKERDAAYKRYLSQKKEVDSIESSYAKKSKSLEFCERYPRQKEKREALRKVFVEQSGTFQKNFDVLIHGVEEVTTRTLRRYLHLNAGFLSSVIEALTSSDATVVEAMELYRLEQLDERKAEEERREEKLRESKKAPDEVPTNPSSTLPSRKEDGKQTSSTPASVRKGGSGSKPVATLSCPNYELKAASSITPSRRTTTTKVPASATARLPSTTLSPPANTSNDGRKQGNHVDPSTLSKG